MIKFSHPCAPRFLQNLHLKRPLSFKLFLLPSFIRAFSMHLCHFLSSLSDRQWYELSPPQFPFLARASQVSLVVGQNFTIPSIVMICIWLKINNAENNYGLSISMKHVSQQSNYRKIVFADRFIVSTIELTKLRL